MSVLDLQAWADEAEAIRFPAILSDISALQVQGNATSAALMAKSQELSDALDAHTVSISAAQTDADDAQLDATLALTRIYQTGLDAITYTNSEIQKLRVELGARVDAVQEAVDDELVTQIDTTVIAEVASVNAAFQAKVAEMQALADGLIASLDNFDGVTGTLLDTTLPELIALSTALQTEVEGYNYALDTLLTGYTLPTLAQGFDSIVSKAEQDIQALGHSILRPPASVWTLDSATAVFSPKAVVPSTWFQSDDTVFGECLELPDGTNQTIGQAYPALIRPDRIYRILARFRVTDDGADAGVKVAIGVTTWASTVLTEQALEKDLLMGKASIAGGVRELSCYFSGDQSLLETAGLSVGTTGDDDALAMDITGDPNKAFFYFRQNTGGATDGRVRLASFEVSDVTDNSGYLIAFEAELAAAEAAAAAAQEARDEAQTAAASADGSATASSGHADNAAASASGANSSAVAAAAEVTAANTARSGAEAAETASVAAKDSAIGSAASAQTSATLSADSRDEAGTFAAVALSYKDDASTFASEAEQSATLSTSERLLAQTAKSEAEAAEGRAAISETNADSSEAAAAITMSLSASASRLAQSAAQGNLIADDTLTDVDAWFSHYSHPTVGKFNVAIDGGYGYRHADAGIAWWYQKQTVRVDETKVYRLTMEYRISADAASTYFTYRLGGSTTYTNDTLTVVKDGTWRTMQLEKTAAAFLTTMGLSGPQDIEFGFAANHSAGAAGSYAEVRYLRVEDITNAKAAQDAATASASSATIASASEDASGQYAVAAQEAQLAAETAESNASISEFAAAGSESDAAGSASAANVSANLSADSATAAGDSATASAASATLAATSVTDAGQEALAANTAKLAAETAQSAAGVSQVAAANSATDAAGSEALSTTASTVSTSAKDAAVLVEGNPDFALGYEGWYGNYLLPASDLSAIHGLVGTFEGRQAFSSTVNQSRYVTQKKVWYLEPGRKYRVRAAFFPSGGTSKMYAGVVVSDAAGANYGTNAGLHYNITSGGIYPDIDDWYARQSVVFTLADLQAVKGAAAAGVRMVAFLNYDNAAGVSVGLDGIWLEDVTATEAAAASATAAASSASAASTSASAAGTSATAANTAKVNAETAQGAASTSETNAATSATNASGSESAASTFATNASNSATAAGNSATAASTSASTATTKAGEAGTSALAASGSANTATTKAGEASTSETNAASSATDADGFSATAIAARDVTVAVKNTLEVYGTTLTETDFKRDGEGWAYSYALNEANLATALSIVEAYPEVTIVEDSVEGNVLQSVGKYAAMSERTLRPKVLGQKIRLAMRHRVTVEADTGFNSTQWIVMHTANGAYRTYFQIGNSLPDVVDGWVTKVIEFIPSDIMQATDTHWRLMIGLNGYHHSGVPTGFTHQISSITTEDITQVAAEATTRAAAVLTLEASLASFESSANAQFGSLTATVTAQGTAFTDFTGAFGEYTIGAYVDGATSDITMTAIKLADGSTASSVVIDTALFQVNSDLALFGGDLGSDNFVTGVSGWFISQAGDAEFNNLINRAALVDGAVSDGLLYLEEPAQMPVHNEVLQEGVIGEMTPNQLWHISLSVDFRRAGFTNLGDPETLDYAVGVRVYVQISYYNGSTWSGWNTLFLTGWRYDNTWEQTFYVVHLVKQYPNAKVRTVVETNSTHPSAYDQDYIRNLGVSARAVVR